MDRDKIIEQLKDDELYYGEFGKQFLSNSDLKFLKNSKCIKFGNYIRLKLNNVNLISPHYFI